MIPLSVHPIRLATVAIATLLRRRRQQQGLQATLHSVTTGRSSTPCEAANRLWRGAMAQMRALNTATAWPAQRRRMMRAEAERRLNRYFTQVERMIALNQGVSVRHRAPPSTAEQ